MRYGGLAALFIFLSPLYAQEIIPNLHAYRTALATDAIGDWDDPSTWEIWDGTSWAAAPVPPDRNNDVFIEKDNEVRLTKNEEVANLYLYGRDSTESPPGKKLNLQIYDMDIYGALICFRGVGGTYSFQNLTSGTTDWIYPETGNIVFKGNSRTVVDRPSWSASNQNSRFGVVFNPEPDAILTINAGFKANRFTIVSGTIFQTVNTHGQPATSTFSFNNHAMFGADDYGNFTIEPGATLISEGTREFNQIIRRSDGKPASNFHLKEGGTLILLGQEPIIEAVDIQLEGNVYYSGSTGTQQFIRGSMAGVSSPFRYKHLFFDGDAVKKPPDFIELTGNFTFLDGGSVNTTDTAIHFIGDSDQEIINVSLDLKDAVIDKASGVLSFDQNLIVHENLNMTSGKVDFKGHQLYIHGNYNYTAGSWDNLSQLLYENLPANLVSDNSTFPFVDAYLGGVRKIVLSGTLSSANTGITITYHQLPDINWDPGFEDNGVPILYALNSYFQFNAEDFIASDQLNVWISLDNLIIVDEEHARLVGIDAAAPGSHLSSQGGLAGRAVTLADLHGEVLTIGSTGVMSILPVTWLSYQAEELSNGNLISWGTTKEEGNSGFVILKSIDALKFEEIGHVPGSGYSNQTRHYQFLDRTANLSDKIYYQIKSLDSNGNQEASPIFQLIVSKALIRIFPNPYEQGHDQLTLIAPGNIGNQPARIRIKNVLGMLLLEQSGASKTITTSIAERIKVFPAGTYFIIVAVNGEGQVIKWIKKH